MILNTVVLIFLAISANSQNSVIEKMMDKYSSQEGIVSVNISGDFLKAFLEPNEKNKKSTIFNLRILSIDDESLNSGVNFYEEVMPKLKSKDYKTLMKVKEKDSDFVIVQKESKNGKNEYLLISGGNDNAMIYVEGNISTEDLDKISNEIR